LTKGIAVAAIALALPLTMGSSANAAPLMAGSALSTTNTATSSDITQVRWRGHRGGWGHHHHGGGWGGVGAGLAAGALIGGAIAASQGPYYYGPGYGYAPAPAYVEGDAVGYCMQRFKSYDPRSGTYLGYDGLRHPCP
jgi:hypothetical protein